MVPSASSYRDADVLHFVYVNPTQLYFQFCGSALLPSVVDIILRFLTDILVGLANFLCRVGIEI